MIIDKDAVSAFNERYQVSHERQFVRLQEALSEKGINTAVLLAQLQDFQVAIPSWALGTGGTRFGRFPGGGEPASLEQKIEDIGLLHTLNRSSGAVSLHIPWDIPEDPARIRQLAAAQGLRFDAVNSNTFQDQPGQDHSYKFGSLSHTDAAVREQAVQHNIEVIRHGVALGSRSLSLWLSDGSCFPGQQNLAGAFNRTLESLQAIYEALPGDWEFLVEYKPYEPNFYSTVIQDWGTSHLLCTKLGDKARVLVDLGHHLPNTNLEQIVALLINERRLGGFHFNDSKYGDDDLTVGSIRPYLLFLIFNELVEGIRQEGGNSNAYAWMIDASHNVKDPLEDLLQSVEAILIAFAQAMLINREALDAAQQDNDPVQAQQLLQDAFRTDVRPLVREAMLRAGGVLDPIGAFREFKVRQRLIEARGMSSQATGL